MKKIPIIVLFLIAVIPGYGQEMEHAISVSFTNGLSGTLYKPAIGTQKQSWGYQGGVDYSGVFGTLLSESKFGFSIGVAYASMKNKYTLPEFSQAYNAIDIDGESYLHKDKISNYKETQTFGYLNIPIMFRWELNPIYIEIGPIVGFNIYSKVKNSAKTVNTSGAYEQAIEDFENIPQLGFFTINDYTGELKPKLGFNLAAGLEFGYFYDMKAGQFGISLLCQYGLLNINKENTRTEFFQTINSDRVRELSINSVLTSELDPIANTPIVKKINPIMFGLKLQYRFKLGNAEDRWLRQKNRWTKKNQM